MPGAVWLRVYECAHPTITIIPSDRILYDGNYYDITSIYDYDDNRMYTVAVAQRSE